MTQPRQARKNSTREWFDEYINYGGFVRTRGEVIVALQQEGAPARLIDIYVTGAIALPFVLKRFDALAVGDAFWSEHPDTALTIPLIKQDAQSGVHPEIPGLRVVIPTGTGVLVLRREPASKPMSAAGQNVNP